MFHKQTKFFRLSRANIPGVGFVLGITKAMKILNLVKERVKYDSQGLGLQDEGKKKEKPEEVHEPR